MNWGQPMLAAKYFDDARKLAELAMKTRSVASSQVSCIFAVGEPASGLLLFVFNDSSRDLAAPGIIAGRDLLQHLHFCTGNQLFTNRFVHRWIKA